MYDPKKDKDATTEKFYLNKHIFTKFLIKSWYETYIHHNPSDIEMKITYCEHLFHRLRISQYSIYVMNSYSYNLILQSHIFRNYRLLEIIKK